jgi:asparagine synthase (glutamine-hydrolysing)
MEPVLPREVIYRRKAGFGAPVRAWLVGELGPMVDDLLSPAAIKQRGLFDPGEVRRLIAANRAGHEDNALRIWALLTLELWQRTFLDADADVGRQRGPARSPAPTLAAAGTSRSLDA